MRIISEFHDYYDVMQKHGYEEGLLYLRETKEIYELMDRGKGDGGIFFHYDSDWRDPLPRPHVNAEIISFCGELHPVLIIDYDHKYICSNANEVDEVVVENFKKRFRERYYSDDKYSDYNFWNYENKKFNQKSVKKYFDDLPANFKINLEATHQKYKCPIISYSSYIEYPDGVNQRYSRKIVLNPCLKPLDFFRIKATEIAFQEIAQYLSGVLGVANKEMPKIPDKTMAEIKGFDNWSFRKEPTKRKK